MNLIDRLLGPRIPDKKILIAGATHAAGMFIGELEVGPKLDLTYAQTELLGTYFAGYILKKGGSDLSYLLNLPEAEVARRNFWNFRLVKGEEARLRSIDSAADTVFAVGDRQAQLMSKDPQMPYIALALATGNRTEELIQFFQSTPGLNPDLLYQLVGKPDGIKTIANQLTHPIFENVEGIKRRDRTSEEKTDLEMQAVIERSARERAMHDN